MPVGAVAAMAALDGVASIELARKLVKRLNVSVPATGATLLRTGVAPNWTGSTGKGVIVGIVDDGLDFRHRDFRNVDGTTRLLGLGISVLPALSAAACRTKLWRRMYARHAQRRDRGGRDGLHAAFVRRSWHPRRQHRSRERFGDRGGQAAYRFVGMAPEADLLVANPMGGGAVTTGVGCNGVDEGPGAAAGKPLAINLSLGSYYGARDGTSNFQLAMSAPGGRA